MLYDQNAITLDINDKNDIKISYIWKFKSHAYIWIKEENIIEIVKYLELDNVGKIYIQTRHIAKVVLEGKQIDLKGQKND